MSNVEDRIAALSAEQRALLELKLKQKRTPAPAVPQPAPQPASPQPGQVRDHVDFSLFYFSSDEQALPDDKYRLVVQGTRLADQHGFAAVWTPERHFHPFGGLYPNPSVLSAALAMVTERIQLRAGSVVLPLHDPIRVAEEWSIVDNLSQGRVGLAFASGWHPNDFVFRPEHFAARKALMFQAIETVRSLWQGRPLTTTGGTGSPVEVTVFPKPVQAQLPIWITAARSAETFVQAAQIGASVLTSLIDLSVEQLAERIALYRATLQECGYPSGHGSVTVMAHTFIGDDRQQTHDIVRGPFYSYLRAHGELGKALAQTTTAPAAEVRPEDEEALLAFAFERYINGQSLIGTPEACAAVVERLRLAGVDEIACLIDFGVDAARVMEGLARLVALKAACDARREQHAA